MKIRGYASIFGNRDSVGDTVDRGAFSRWIYENPTKALSIFWTHDHMPPFGKATKRPIGITTYLQQTETGLYFEGLTAETPKAIEIATLIELKAITGASFGYGKYPGGVRRVGRRRHLTALKPAEITVCNWGLNPLAYVEASPPDQPTTEEIENEKPQPSG